MKVGTVGTGFIVEWFLTSVEKVEGATCIAIYSRKEETGNALANKFQVSKVYTNYQEMLEDKEIDTIYVASPNSLHYRYTLEALQAGKHVICEKPFTSTLTELKHLIEIAKEKQLFLFEAIVTRHMPNFQIIKDHLADLGKIKMVQCNFSQYSSRYNQFLNGENPNVFNPKFSGGALMDLNIYNLHFTMGLFGTPNNTTYFPNIADNGIDTSGVLVLDYQDFKSICVACKDSSSDYLAVIQGEKGYLNITGPTSLVSNVSLCIGTETKNIGIEEVTPGLYYEVKDFVSMMHQQDLISCYKELDHSYEVFKILYQARIDAGIHFSADDQ